MKSRFIVGLVLGVILSCIVNLFIVWGGLPIGMYWQMQHLREELIRVETQAQETKDYIGRQWLEAK